MRTINSFFVNEQNKTILINSLFTILIKAIAVWVSFYTIKVYLDFFENQVILGVWFTLIAIINWILYFDLGLGDGLRNILPSLFIENNWSEARKQISTTYITMLFFAVFSLIIGLLVVDLIPWNNLFNLSTNIISSNILTKSIKIIYFGIVLQLFLKLICSILLAMQKSAVISFLNLLSNILILLIIKLLPLKSLEVKLLQASCANVITINIPLIVTSLILFSGKLKFCKPSIKQFKLTYAKNSLIIGMKILWLQLIFMIINSTNEILITIFENPESVVEYQTYNKIFGSIASIFSMFLIPIWSAVTKEKAKNNIKWILNLHKFLYFLVVCVIVIEIILLPFLQNIIEIWLGSNIIKIDMKYAIVFMFNSLIFVIHYINTSFDNGLSFFRYQTLYMTIASFINIPLAFVLTRFFNNWIGVVLANIISILFYELSEPFQIRKYLNDIIKDKEKF